MFVILGATGNIGSNVVKRLAAAGEQVIAVVHDLAKSSGFADGVEAVAVDVRDSAALRSVFQRAKRAFLLNPPGDPSGDSNASELQTGRSIAEALNGSGLEKAVLASTYGAQKGEAVGDLSTLYAFEQWALASGVPVAINRGAYYFTNLNMLVDAAKAGALPTTFPPNLVLPMVAPSDLAQAAVERLHSGVDDVGVVNVEGPQRYTFAQVAEAFGKVLGREVALETTPREQWEDSYKAIGFSEQSARAFARMAGATVDAPYLPEQPWRGKVRLEDYVRWLVTGEQ